MAGLCNHYRCCVGAGRLLAGRGTHQPELEGRRACGALPGRLSVWSVCIAGGRSAASRDRPRTATPDRPAGARSEVGRGGPWARADHIAPGMIRQTDIKQC
ncbi:hypothetical protein [Haematobacter missouriensis]|uniref:hypothetical protein n=1 Tax=Haematobacter missouriensis TaxID=366616 RepID=UPI001179AD1D|nr:hypothetical protein [Haematobacter missouriensis]